MTTTHLPAAGHSEVPHPLAGRCRWNRSAVPGRTHPSRPPEWVNYRSPLITEAALLNAAK